MLIHLTQVKMKRIKIIKKWTTHASSNYETLFQFFFINWVNGGKYKTSNNQLI